MANSSSLVTVGVRVTTFRLQRSKIYALLLLCNLAIFLRVNACEAQMIDLHHRHQHQHQPEIDTNAPTTTPPSPHINADNDTNNDITGSVELDIINAFLPGLSRSGKSMTDEDQAPFFDPPFPANIANLNATELLDAAPILNRTAHKYRDDLGRLRLSLMTKVASWLTQFAQLPHQSIGEQFSEEFRAKLNRSLDQLIEQLRLSPYCLTSLYELYREVAVERQVWPLKYLDSIEFLGAGLASGYLSSYGAFEQCINIAPPRPIENEFGFANDRRGIRGKYCMSKVRLSLMDPEYESQTSNYNNNNNNNNSLDRDQLKRLILTRIRGGNFERTNVELRLFAMTSFFDGAHFRFGICVPAACSAPELEFAANQFLAPLQGLLNFTIDPQCTELHAPIRFNTHQIVAIFILAVLALQVFIATCYEYYFEADVRENEIAKFEFANISQCNGGLDRENGKNLTQNSKIISSCSSASKSLYCLHLFRKYLIKFSALSNLKILFRLPSTSTSATTANIATKMGGNSNFELARSKNNPDLDIIRSMITVFVLIELAMRSYVFPLFFGMINLKYASTGLQSKYLTAPEFRAFRYPTASTTTFTLLFSTILGYNLSKYFSARKKHSTSIFAINFDSARNYLCFIANQWSSVVRRSIGPILAIYLMPQVARGPVWHYFEQLISGPCEDWRLLPSLALVNNYLPALSDVCNPAMVPFATIFQLSTLAPILVYAYHRFAVESNNSKIRSSPICSNRSIVGALRSPLLLFSAICIAAAIGLIAPFGYPRLPVVPQQIAVSSSAAQSKRAFMHTLFAPDQMIVPLIVGLFVGVIIATHRRRGPKSGAIYRRLAASSSPLFRSTLYAAVTILFLVAQIWNSHFSPLSDDAIARNFSANFITWCATNKVLWCAVLSSLVYACAVRLPLFGVASAILSAEQLAPLNRLTIGAYISHFAVYSFRVLRKKEMIEIDHIDALSNSICDIVICFTLSFIWYLVIEMPMHHTFRACFPLPLGGGDSDTENDNVQNGNHNNNHNQSHNHHHNENDDEDEDEHEDDEYNAGQKLNGNQSTQIELLERTTPEIDNKFNKNNNNNQNNNNNNNNNHINNNQLKSYEINNNNNISQFCVIPSH